MEVERAADLYAQGWTLRQIGAELGVPWTAVGHQLRRAGVTMRRGGPPSHPASTQQIRELRDQGLTRNEVAKQVGMTVSGAWSRYRGPGRPSPHAWGVGSRSSPTPWTRTAMGVRAAVADHLGRTPTRAELTAARRPQSGRPWSCSRASRAGRRYGRRRAGEPTRREAGLVDIG
jgi:hypothetical protein